MSISRPEAVAALSDIDRATDRSQTLRGDRFAGPILMLWGIIWAFGYAAMGVLPARQWGTCWVGLDLLGFALTAFAARSGGGMRQGRWRGLLVSVAAMVFAGTTLALFRGRSVDAYFVFPGLLCGFIYFALGIWRMKRLAWIGLAMFVASLLGLQVFPQWMAFWMAAVGGGGLFAGGLWLRKA